MSLFKKRPTFPVGPPPLGKKQDSVLSFIGSKKKDKDKHQNDLDEYSDNDSYNGEDSPRQVEEPSDALSFLLGKKGSTSAKPTPERPAAATSKKPDNEDSGTDLSVSYNDYDDDDYEGGDDPSWAPKERGGTDVLSFLLSGKKSEKAEPDPPPRQRKETDVLSFLRAAPGQGGKEEGEEQEEEEVEAHDGSRDVLSFLLSAKRGDNPSEEANEEEVEEGKGGGDVLSFLLSAKRTDDGPSEAKEGGPPEEGFENHDVHHDDDDDDFDPDVKFGEDLKGKKVIKAATVNRLIDSLLTGADPVHRNSFLMTYRGFLLPEKLLEAMEDRYEPEVETNPGNNQRRVRIVGVLKAWVEQFFYDFEEEEIRTKFEGLLKMMEPTMGSSADRLRKVFIKSQKEHEKKMAANAKLHQDTKLNRKPRPPPVRELEAGWKEIDERTIAEQMTLLESNFFNPILPKECLGWNKKNKEILCRNIWRMIQHFNEISSWVRTQIVRECRLKNRIELLKRFIRLMEELRSLNNFNGMMEVLSGLNSAAVRRMKKTFGGIGSDYRKKLKSIEDLLSHQFSYRAYREHLHTIAPPCIPYMGVYLTDLTFILDGNPNFIDGNLVNFFKFKKVAEIVIEIQQYQIEYRSLQTRPHLSSFFLSLDWMGEEDCYRWSSWVEAKKIEETVGQLIHEEEKLRKQLNQLKQKEFELLSRLKSLQPVPPRPPHSASFIPTTCHPGKYYALWNYPASSTYELATDQGEILTLTKPLNDDWSYFKDTKGKVGLIPVTFVRKFAEGGAVNAGMATSSGSLTARAAASAGGRPSNIRKHSVQSLRLCALSASSSPIVPPRHSPSSSPDIQTRSSPSPPSRKSIDASGGPPPRPAKPRKPSKPVSPRLANSGGAPPSTPPIITHADSPKMMMIPRDVAVPPPISPNTSPKRGNLKVKGKERGMVMNPTQMEDGPGTPGERRSKRLNQGVIGARSRVGSTADESGLGSQRCASTTSLSGTAEAWEKDQVVGGHLPQHGAAFSTSFSSLPVGMKASSTPMAQPDRGGSFDQGFTKLPDAAKKEDLEKEERGSGTPKLKKRESVTGGSLIKKGTPSWLLKSPSRNFGKQKDKDGKNLQ